jgi:hypothetical protein
MIMGDEVGQQASPVCAHVERASKSWVLSMRKGAQLSHAPHSPNRMRTPYAGAYTGKPQVPPPQSVYVPDHDPFQGMGLEDYYYDSPSNFDDDQWPLTHEC